MDRQPWILDGKSWSDQLSPAIINLMRPFRMWIQKSRRNLLKVDMKGIEHLQKLRASPFISKTLLCEAKGGES